MTMRGGDVVRGLLGVALARAFGRKAECAGLEVIFQTDGFLVRIRAAIDGLPRPEFRRLVVACLKRVVEWPMRDVRGTGIPAILCLSPNEWGQDAVLWSIGLVWFAAWFRTRKSRHGEEWRAKTASRWARRAAARMALSVEDLGRSSEFVHALASGKWSFDPYS